MDDDCVDETPILDEETLSPDEVALSLDKD